MVSYLKKRNKEEKQRNVDPNKGGNVLKASHASETRAILWVLSGNKDELFLALCQEDISLTGTRTRTQWQIKKVFNDESFSCGRGFSHFAADVRQSSG